MSTQGMNYRTIGIPRALKLFGIIRGVWAILLIRAFVLSAIAVCLLPFKLYDPILCRIVIFMLAVYVPWCIVHGILLTMKLTDPGLKGQPAIVENEYDQNEA